MTINYFHFPKLLRQNTTLSRVGGRKEECSVLTIWRLSLPYSMRDKVLDCKRDDWDFGSHWNYYNFVALITS